MTNQSFKIKRDLHKLGLEEVCKKREKKEPFIKNKNKMSRFVSIKSLEPCSIDIKHKEKRNSKNPKVL
jgi:hypothetical protein